MSKAEERAKELFPLLETDKIGNNPYILYNTEQLSKQEGFIEGYHQAEKDLEFSWEDVRRIYLLVNSTINDVGMDNLTDKSIYQEVLKRFKEIKEK